MKLKLHAVLREEEEGDDNDMNKIRKRTSNREDDENKDQTGRGRVEPPSTSLISLGSVEETREYLLGGCLSAGNYPRRVGSG